MPKNTKRMCLNLIAEKKLPYTIKRIGQIHRLINTSPLTVEDVCVSPAIFSWDRLYTQLQNESGGATS